MRRLKDAAADRDGAGKRRQAEKFAGGAQFERIREPNGQRQQILLAPESDKRGDPATRPRRAAVKLDDHAPRLGRLQRNGNRLPQLVRVRRETEPHGR